MGIKSAMACSLRKRAEGGIKESREGSLDEGGVWAAMSPKGERRGSGRGTRARIKSGPEARKRSCAQCTRTASAEKLLFE